MSANLLKISTNLMGMKVSDLITPSHMTHLSVTDIIEVAATEGMTIDLHFIPRGAFPMLDATGAIPDGDPILGVPLTLIHPGDILTSHDLHPADPIHVAKANPDQDVVEGMAIAPGVVTA